MTVVIIGIVSHVWGWQKRCFDVLNDSKLDTSMVKVVCKQCLKYSCPLLDPGMSLNCAPTRVCRKSASRPGYVVKVCTDSGYVVKQCPRIVMNKIFDWH